MQKQNGVAAKMEYQGVVKSWGWETDENWFLHQKTKIKSSVSQPRFNDFSTEMIFLEKKRKFCANGYWGIWKPTKKITQYKANGDKYLSNKKIYSFDTDFIPKQLYHVTGFFYEISKNTFYPIFTKITPIKPVFAVIDVKQIDSTAQQAIGNSTFVSREKFDHEIELNSSIFSDDFLNFLRVNNIPALPINIQESPFYG